MTHIEQIETFVDVTRYLLAPSTALTQPISAEDRLALKRVLKAYEAQALEVRLAAMGEQAEEHETEVVEGIVAASRSYCSRVRLARRDEDFQKKQNDLLDFLKSATLPPAQPQRLYALATLSASYLARNYEARTGVCELYSAGNRSQ